MKTIFTGLFIFFSFFGQSQEDQKPFKIINKSNHETELMFDNQSHKFIRFRSDLFKNWQVFKSDSSLIVNFHPKGNFLNQLEIEYDTVKFRTIERKSNIHTDTLKAYSFRTNLHYYYTDSVFNVEEIFKTTKYKFSDANVVLYQEGNRCTDSGMNSIKIIFKNGFIHFKNLNNIKFFEYDINKDGKNEIYIINFSCCDEKLKIFRVI